MDAKASLTGKVASPAPGGTGTERPVRGAPSLFASKGFVPLPPAGGGGQIWPITRPNIIYNLEIYNLEIYNL
jgi:hypothetical protein